MQDLRTKSNESQDTDRAFQELPPKCRKLLSFALFSYFTYLIEQQRILSTVDICILLNSAATIYRIFIRKLGLLYSCSIMHCFFPFIEYFICYTAYNVFKQLGVDVFLFKDKFLNREYMITRFVSNLIYIDIIFMLSY